MIINGVTIDKTFAEAFPMKATRAIITAQNEKWAMISAQAMTGFATSVIACGCEAGIERVLSPDETPDGRPGVAIMIYAMGGKGLAKQLETRAGQCVLTSPTSALFAGIEGGKPIPLGKNLRYFGDGFQIAKKIGGKRYWRVPVMDGEFLTEATTGMVDAVGGGNFLVLAESQPQALAACEAAIEEMRKMPNVIMPFPWRRGALWLQSRLKIRLVRCIDQRCLLPDIKRCDQDRSIAGDRIGDGNRHRRLDERRHR